MLRVLSRFADAEEARGLGTQPQPASQGAAAEGAPAEGQAAASGRVQASDSILAGGQRTYLGAVVVANVVGLLTAFAANSITHMGQVSAAASSWEGGVARHGVGWAHRWARAAQDWDLLSQGESDQVASARLSSVFEQTVHGHETFGCE